MHGEAGCRAGRAAACATVCVHPCNAASLRCAHRGRLPARCPPPASTRPPRRLQVQPDQERPAAVCSSNGGVHSTRGAAAAGLQRRSVDSWVGLLQADSGMRVNGLRRRQYQAALGGTRRHQQPALRERGAAAPLCPPAWAPLRLPPPPPPIPNTYIHTPPPLPPPPLQAAAPRPLLRSYRRSGTTTLATPTSASSTWASLCWAAAPSARAASSGATSQVGKGAEPLTASTRALAAGRWGLPGRGLARRHGPPGCGRTPLLASRRCAAPPPWPLLSPPAANVCNARMC